MGRDVRRVLLLLPGAFGELGGIQMYNRLLIKAFSELMAERGGVCDVFVLNDPPDCFDARYGTSATQVRNFSRRKRHFSLAALRHARTTRPDLVVFGHVNFGSLALALRMIVPSAQWFITHGVDVWRRLRLPIRHALERAEKILSVSDYTKRELVRCNGLSGSNITLQPNALDPFWVEDYSELAASATFPADPVLLSCARLTRSDRYKGFDCVLRALPTLVTQHPRLKYIVIGEGDDRPYLESVASEAGVREHVEFCGRASQDELARAYAECTLFIMPSRKEGFGIVFLEAAFFGKPSIGGNHGGTPEVIEDGVTGWLVEHGKPEAIAEALAVALKGDVAHTTGSTARTKMNERYSYGAYRDGLLRQLSSPESAV